MRSSEEEVQSEREDDGADQHEFPREKHPYLGVTAVVLLKPLGQLSLHAGLDTGKDPRQEVQQDCEAYGEKN